MPSSRGHAVHVWKGRLGLAAFAGVLLVCLIGATPAIAYVPNVFYQGPMDASKDVRTTGVRLKNGGELNNLDYPANSGFMYSIQTRFGDGTLYREKTSNGPGAMLYHPVGINGYSRCGNNAFFSVQVQCVTYNG